MGSFCLHLSFLSYLWCSLPSLLRKGVIAYAFNVIQFTYGTWSCFNFARHLSCFLCSGTLLPSADISFFCRIILLSPDVFPACSVSSVLILQTLLLLHVFLYPTCGAKAQISICPLVITYYVCIYAQFCEKMLVTGILLIALQFYRILVHHLGLCCCSVLMFGFKASKCNLYLLLLYG